MPPPALVVGRAKAVRIVRLFAAFDAALFLAVFLGLGFRLRRYLRRPRPLD